MEESKFFNSNISESNDGKNFDRDDSTSDVEVSHKSNNLSNCIWITKNGRQLPVECSLDKNKAIFNEISRVVLEECEGIRSYKIFNRIGSVTSKDSLSKTDLPALYSKASLKETCLGVFEETKRDGVIEFEGKESIKNYIYNFMASCKLDYGSFTSLLNSLVVK